MNPEQIDLPLTGKTPSQAVSMGFAFARRHRWGLLTAALIAIAPVFLLALLLLFWLDKYFYAMVLIWWFKPYYDVVILQQGSRLLSRQSTSLTDCLLSLKVLFTPTLWVYLTWGRITLLRHISLPISFLEKINGKAHTQRLKNQSKSSKSVASSSTMGLFHFDLFLYLNCFIILLFLLPQDSRADATYWFLSNDPNKSSGDFYWLAALLLLCQSFCTAVVEIFYVMTGFMLYLNNRITVEGWGIEMGFKQMAKRLQSLPKTSNMGISILITTLALGLAMPQNGAAAETIGHTKQTVILTPEADKAQLKTLLLDKDISPYATQITWQKKTDDKHKKNTQSLANINKAPADLGRVAFIIKWVLIALVSLILLLGLYRYRGLFAVLKVGKKNKAKDSPQVLFGLAVTPDSLPQDVGEKAQQLFAEKDFVQTLSLLYRGSLSVLINDYQADIWESHTEGDCLKIAKTHLSDNDYRYFSSLTDLWRGLVYAHQTPSVQESARLIKQWNSVFQTRVRVGDET